MKAKSRLKSVITSNPPASDASSSPPPSSVIAQSIKVPAQEVPTHHQRTRHMTERTSFDWKKYLPYLPTLLLSLPFYFGVYYLVTRVYPADIKDLVLPNSYLVFHLVLWIANYFLLSFLFLNSRRGFLAALLAGLLVFAKMQSYFLPWQVIFGLIGIFVIIELLLSGIQKISNALPSESQVTSTHRPRRRPARKRS